MIEIDIRLEVGDRRRRFGLDVQLASRHDRVALFGASGAGKSLTLAAVAGLQRPGDGSIRLGRRMLFDAAAGIDLPASERGIGMLFQQYALFPHLSVRRNVAFGLTSWRRRLADDDAAQVDALLDRFGLAALAESRPAQLSGGQQQRVALARALACRPQALLLDEPLAALNPRLRRQLRGELRTMLDQAGLPLMLVTHDADDALELADEAFLIDEGRIVGHLELQHDRAAAELRAFGGG